MSLSLSIMIKNSPQEFPSSDALEVGRFTLKDKEIKERTKNRKEAKTGPTQRPD